MTRLKSATHNRISLAACSVLLAAVCCILASQAFRIAHDHDLPAGLATDEAAYVIGARVLTGNEFWYDNAESYRSLPPLTSAVLALSYTFTSWSRAHLLMIAVSLAALVLTAMYSATLIQSPAIRLVPPVLVALTPFFWIQQLSVASEMLYLSLVILALLMMDHDKHRQVSVRRAALVGVMVGLAVACRTQGIALFAAAFVTYRFTRATIVCVGLAIVIWAILGQLLNGPSGYEGVVGATLERSVLDPLAQLGMMAHLTANAAGSLGQLLSPNGETLFTFQPSLLVAVVLAMSISLVVNYRRHTALCVYLTISCLIIVSWPYPTQTPRFVFALLPLLLVSLLVSIQRLRSADSLIAMLIVVWCISAIPAFHNMTKRYLAAGQSPIRSQRVYYMSPTEKAGRYFANAELALFGDLTLVGTLTQEDHTTSWIKPHFGSLLAQRRFVMTPPVSDCPRKFAEALATTKADYLFLTDLLRQDRPLGHGAKTIYDRIGEVIWYSASPSGDPRSYLYKLSPIDEVPTECGRQ